MKVTLLGTGTSVGVPMIGCECATCLSDDPRDRRLRTGVLVEAEGRTALIDISADFRQQALAHRITRLDALFLTHCHADHVFGLDDVRPFNFKHGPLPVYASASTWKDVRKVFAYIFEARHVGGGLPQLLPAEISDYQDFDAAGFSVKSIPVVHGKGTVSGFRFAGAGGDFAFVTDCNRIEEESLKALEGLEVLVLDALRLRPHPTHLHLEQSLAYIERVRPRRAYLTHISHDIRHSEINDQLPDGVELAYDGLEIQV